MPDNSTELLKGTLDLLILRTLALEPMHGLGISDRIRQITGGVFVVKPGSLFPALHRLEEKGWLDSRWGETEANRKAKFYRITESGKKQLEQEKQNWLRVLTAVNQVIEQES